MNMPFDLTNYFANIKNEATDTINSEADLLSSFPDTYDGRLFFTPDSSAHLKEELAKECANVNFSTIKPAIEIDDVDKNTKCIKEYKDTNLKKSKSPFNNNDVFVRILKNHPILLNKSQTPSVKSSKKEALDKFSELYTKETGKKLLEKQIYKKINNLKTYIKKKIRKNRGSVPTLKKWERTIYDILESYGKSSNASIATSSLCTKNVADKTQKHPTKKHIENSSPVEKPQNNKRENFETRHKKTKINEGMVIRETEETKNMTVLELQRLVLLEQLSLIRLKKTKYLAYI